MYIHIPSSYLPAPAYIHTYHRRCLYHPQNLRALECQHLDCEGYHIQRRKSSPAPTNASTLTAVLEHNPLLSTLLVWGLSLYADPNTGVINPTSMPVLKVLVNHFGARVSALHIDIGSESESYHARPGKTAGYHAILPAPCFDALRPETTGPRLPEAEGPKPRPDPFVGRLVRLTSGMDLPVAVGDGPLMLCLSGWEIWINPFELLMDGLTPGNLRQLSISSVSMELLYHCVPQLQAFGRKHGASIHCLHLGDQGNNFTSPQTDQQLVVRTLFPFLPNLITLRVGSLLMRGNELGPCSDFPQNWEHFAELFLCLDKHCPALRNLHIWHDLVFWNDPETLRQYQRFADTRFWCRNNLECTLEDVYAAIHRVLGRLDSHEGLPPGLVAFLLAEEQAEATVTAGRTHANLKLQPKLIVTASSSTGGSGTPVGVAVGATASTTDSVPQQLVDAMFAAVERGSLEEVRELVETRGVPVCLKNSKSRSPLYAATLLGHGPIVEFLLQRHAEDNGAAYLSGNADMRRIFAAHGYGKMGKMTLLNRCNMMGTATNLCALLMKEGAGSKGGRGGTQMSETLTASEQLVQWRRVVFMAVLTQESDTQFLPKLLQTLQLALQNAPEAVYARADWRSIVHSTDKTLPCPAYPKTLAILRSRHPGPLASAPPSALQRVLWAALDSCLLPAPHDVLRVGLQPVLPLTTISRAMEHAVAVTLHKGVCEPYCYIGGQKQLNPTGPSSSARCAVDYSIPGTQARPLSSPSSTNSPPKNTSTHTYAACIQATPLCSFSRTS